MDMRRAVMVVNALSVVFNAVALVLIHAQAIPWYDGGNIYQETKNDLQENQQDQADIMDDLLRKLTILAVVGLAVSMVALRGAYTYNHRLVILQAIYAVINCTLTIYYNKDASQNVDTYDYRVTYSISSIIGTAISVYVHMALVREIRNGIMTPQTYATREAYSCCCLGAVDNGDDDDADDEEDSNRKKTVTHDDSV